MYLDKLFDSLCFIPHPLSTQGSELGKAKDKILGMLDEDRMLLGAEAFVIEAEAGERGREGGREGASEK